MLPGLEHAQQIAAHESQRTTKLYNRTRDQVLVDEIERIDIDAFAKDVGEKQDARAHILAIRACANKMTTVRMLPGPYAVDGDAIFG